MIQGGSTANRNGKTLEKMMRTALESVGCQELTPEEKDELRAYKNVSMFPYDKWFTTQIRMYDSIYQRPFVADFVVYSKSTLPDGVLVEAKWQGSAGSVDEKYVFTVMTLKQKDMMPTMLVIDGTGARPDAIAWIKRQQNPRFKMKTLAEFIAWAHSEV